MAISKHITVNLQEGQKFKVAEYWGPRLGNKTVTVVSWRWSPHCESCIMVRIKEYEHEIDSNWLEPIIPQISSD